MLHLRICSALWSLTFPLLLAAQLRSFDFTAPQPDYSDVTGYGYDLGTRPATAKAPLQPFYFSLRVPDGNYRVTVTLGHRRQAASTAVRAESRRLFIEETTTRKGEFRTVSFLVNKRSPRIDDNLSVSLKPRELSYLNWDDRLTLEFAGQAPAVSKITIEPDTTAATLYLIGNSTVVDQESEPYASWGQMIPRWFGDRLAVSNHAESGLACSSFLGQHRLDKILSTLRPQDYVFVEFGHNDQKEHGVGDGAWYNFSHNLKIFIDRVRAKGAQILFVTPTQRRNFDDQGHIKETHGDYPDAMRAVAAREQVPLIELHDMTRTFFEALGVEGSKRALVHYPAGTYPHQDKPLADNTHFNPYGAYEVAKMIVLGIRALDTAPSASAAPFLPLQQALEPSFPPFDPATPDDPATLRLPAASRVDTTKPDGN